MTTKISEEIHFHHHHREEAVFDGVFSEKREDGKVAATGEKITPFTSLLKLLAMRAIFVLLLGVIMSETMAVGMTAMTVLAAESSSAVKDLGGLHGGSGMRDESGGRSGLTRRHRNIGNEGLQDKERATDWEEEEEEEKGEKGGRKEEEEEGGKRLTTRSSDDTNAEKEQSNGKTVAAGDADEEQRRRLTTVPMEQMRTGFENTPAGGTVTFTEGTYTGTRMGDWDYGIRKAATMECVLGDECVVDGQDHHRCLNIYGVNGARERVTIKRIKVINGYTTSVSAESN